MKLDESGQLSIDFLAGFTIFMIGFIIVITMVSGLLVGLQSRTVDYDAVAYRTGVILVEDPGYGMDPTSANYTTSWEFVPSVDKDDVYRLGLAVTKNTPNILSNEKVYQFFCATRFNPDDIHKKAIFDTDYLGPFPLQGRYRFNVSVVSTDNPQYMFQRGDPVPFGNIGYIRRLVKIKQPINVSIDGGKYMSPSTGSFNVHFDFPSLYSTQQPYRIDPLRDKTSINITNISGSPVPTSVTFFYDNPPADNPPLYNTSGDTPISQLPNGPDYKITTGANYVTLNLDPGFFTSKDVDPGRHYYFNFTFPNGTQIGGNFPVNNINLPDQPTFVPAALEVRIW